MGSRDSRRATNKGRGKSRLSPPHRQREGQGCWSPRNSGWTGGSRSPVARMEWEEESAAVGAPPSRELPKSGKGGQRGQCSQASSTKHPLTGSGK